MIHCYLWSSEIEVMKGKESLLVVFIIIAIAVITRIIPHYPNFTAVGAAALFGGAYFSRRTALLIPIIALFVSNLILNNLLYRTALPGADPGFVVFQLQSLWIYAAFILIALMSFAKIRPSRLLSVLGCSLAASVILFLVSNLGVWVHSALYPKTMTGLLASYTAALPFFWSTIAGDVFYVTVLFGGLALARSYVPGLKDILPEPVRHNR